MKGILAINCWTGKHHFAKRDNYDARVDSNARRALAANIKRLRKAQGWSQEQLSRKSGVAQTTISYIENPDREPSPSPSLDNLEKISSVFDLEVWQLMLAELPDDLLASKSLEKVVQCFIETEEDGRTNITRIAEAEVRYSRKETKK